MIEDIFNETMSLVMKWMEIKANFSNKLTSHLKSKKHFNLENKSRSFNDLDRKTGGFLNIFKNRKSLKKNIITKKRYK